MTTESKQGTFFEAIGAKKPYLKGCSPSCDKEGIVCEIMTRGGIQVVRVR